MKILFFSPYFYPYISGVTVSSKRILDYLKKNNDITILTFLFNRNPDKDVNLNKLNVIQVPYLFKISKGFISPQSIIYFLKFVKNSDLIILSQPNFEGLLLALIAKVLGKKIISIFHCQVFLEGNILSKIVNFVLNISMKTQLNLSDKIVVYTKDYIDSLPYFKKLVNKTVDVLPPIKKYSSDKEFLNKLLKLKGNQIWIGYAGRISVEKGIEYLVEAVHNIVIPVKTGIQIIFAGPYGADVAGENYYYSKIISLLKKYKIKSLFLGNLRSDNLAAFYKSIDILALPSINQTEAFGMVQAEAMMNGTPVIASNLPGVRMPIKLTRMGVITEPKNAKQISRTILSILEKKYKFANDKLVKNAQDIFDIKKVYKFYDDLLASTMYR